jgi:hypothetical protein
MKCDRCDVEIPLGEETDYFGRMLCEECYMQVLSPARACDPWAVRSAQTLSKIDEGNADLSETQAAILQILQETGGTQAGDIAQRLDMKLPELERELATLRHMEKIRGEMRAGKRVVCLWD